VVAPPIFYFKHFSTIPFSHRSPHCELSSHFCGRGQRQADSGDGRWTAVPAGDGRIGQRRFATMEAAEGGGDSSVDVLNVPIVCGSDFP
jgi:hypothetical protein